MLHERRSQRSCCCPCETKNAFVDRITTTDASAADDKRRENDPTPVMCESNTPNDERRDERDGLRMLVMPEHCSGMA